MSDVLIIGGESTLMRRMRATLERDGNTVATAPTVVAALPALYLSPSTLRVIVGGEATHAAVVAIRALMAADPGPLGRHVITVLEALQPADVPD